MLNYIIRRLILLPITLFCILIVNFIILNLAPGDPVSITEISAEGLASRKQDSIAFGSDERFLQFREFYGLTLPIIINNWPQTSQKAVMDNLWQLVSHRENPEAKNELPFREYEQIRVSFGDRARFIMPLLLNIIENKNEKTDLRAMAVRFFVRGGTRQAYLGPNLTEEQKLFNRKIAIDNNLLRSFLFKSNGTAEEMTTKINAIRKWYEENKTFYQFEPSFEQRVGIFFFETRLMRYLSRVLTLDFGTLRNDGNKTVISEVTKRFKYSLTLSIIPLFLTFFFCTFFGFVMAYHQNRWPDTSLNYLFLILYALPVFVVAPFLIEKIALNNTFPFTNIPIPISGFSSPENIYEKQTSLQRFIDIFQHILLPLIAIMYGSLAIQARLSRTAILEVMRQDYVRTAKAKGLSNSTILFKHVGRNAGVTIITSIAGSLGIVLGGSLIVETLFEINGFGKFFYDSIINRDFNVIMFSAIAGSFLTLVGYLLADIAYTIMDPRVTLD